MATPGASNDITFVHNFSVVKTSQHISFLLLVLLLPLSAFAQKIRFTDPCNKWKLFFNVIDVVSDGGEYHFRNDTVVNGKTYRQFKSYGHYIVREDTIVQKVFAVDLTEPDSTEKILYDYTLSQNDTFQCAVARHYVGTVDSVLVGAVWHKVWEMIHVNCDTCAPGALVYDYFVIEGIGSIVEPLGPMDPTYFESSFFLACFRQCGEPEPFNRKIGWTLDNSSSCLKNYGVSVPAMATEAKRIEFWPNPVEELLTVAARLPVQSLNIINSLGQLVLQQKYDQTKVNVTVDVSHLSSGVYFTKVNGIFAGRFVKR